uniref:Putative secreted protein n=1 Tax=Ixodes ricinus TaxID=34613 RepID=A0A6B0U9C3_IXORI
MPLVSFRDWYSMSWPSTFLLAIVKMLLFCSFWETWSAVRLTLSRVYWTSFWAGMSFQVARNTRLSIRPSSVLSTCMGTRQLK